MISFSDTDLQSNNRRNILKGHLAKFCTNSLRRDSPWSLLDLWFYFNTPLNNKFPICYFYLRIMYHIIHCGKPNSYLVIWGTAYLGNILKISISIPKLMCYPAKSLQISSSTICKSNCCFNSNHGEVNLDLLSGSWFINPWRCIIL